MAAIQNSARMPVDAASVRAIPIEPASMTSKVRRAAITENTTEASPPRYPPTSRPMKALP